MREYSTQVKNNLSSLICQMSQSPDLYVKNPKKDFTRNRKLSFEAVVKYLISMGGNSLYKELLDASGFDADTATSSAFIQQRNKILPFAFEYLLRKFAQSYRSLKLYEGYRLLAVDGSSLQLPKNPKDADTYIHNQNSYYNLMHLNALFDLCNNTYVDALVQSIMHINEREALIAMVNRYDATGKTIIVGDRNFEGYNCFAHIQNNGLNYVIRVKDVGSNGILASIPLPFDDEFDVWVKRIIVRNHNPLTKSQPGIYKRVTPGVAFDFLEPESNGQYHISFRVVRFKIEDDSYATVVTNLQAFSSSQIKEIYAMRWGIESSFRALKYTIGLNCFHSKKQEFIAQEVFARLIMYNFTEMITSYVVISHTGKQYDRKINFSVAVTLCRRFLRSLGKSPPFDIEAMIRKNTLPVRPGRKFPHKLRKGRTSVSFVYRIA